MKKFLNEYISKDLISISESALFVIFLFIYYPAFIIYDERGEFL